MTGCTFINHPLSYARGEFHASHYVVFCESVFVASQEGKCQTPRHSLIVGACAHMNTGCRARYERSPPAHLRTIHSAHLNCVSFGSLWGISLTRGVELCAGVPFGFLHLEIRIMATIPAHLRSIVDHDGAVILDMRNDQFFSMNPTGTYIWSRLLNGEMPDQITKTLAEETGTDISVVSADVNEFIAELKSRHLFHFPA